MSKVTIVRQNRVAPTEKERISLQLLLYEFMDGLSQTDKRAWRRLFNRMIKAEPGEMITIEKYERRMLPWHKRHMKMEQEVFKAQEQIDSFKVFRDWCKISIGFVVWIPGPDGAMQALPDTTEFASCSEDKAREYHANWVAFLRTEYAGRTLWPHLTKRKASEMIETILADFGE